MSEQIKSFDLNKIKSGNFKEVEALASDARRSIVNGKNTEFSIPEIAEKLAVNDKWRSEFTDSFNLHAFGDRSSKKVAFDVTKTGTDVVTGTDILPVVEGLIRDTGILSRVDMQTVAPNANKQIWDANEEVDAENLTEVATGTSADDTLRKGDLLIPQYKIQASEKFSEYALNTLDAAEFGMFMARLGRRTQFRVVSQMFYAGSAAANGTAKNFLRGIKNNFGVNGTGDASNFIGAISYANKAAADTALGSASADAYDLCVKVKSILLPNNLSTAEEEAYVYVMNRTTWGKIKTVVDLNGRYKARSAFDPATGTVVKEIDGTPVITSPAIADNEVFLVPLSWYVLVTSTGFLNLNDSGLVQLREGLVTYVNRIWVDGSMRYGQKYKSTTAATIGTTPVDNQQQNAWRSFFIV